MNETIIFAAKECFYDSWILNEIICKPLSEDLIFIWMANIIIVFITFLFLKWFFCEGIKK